MTERKKFQAEVPPSPVCVFFVKSHVETCQRETFSQVNTWLLGKSCLDETDERGRPRRNCSEANGGGLVQHPSEFLFFVFQKISWFLFPSESTALGGAPSSKKTKFSSTWSVGSGQDGQWGLYQHASDECADERKAKGLQTPPKSHWSVLWSAHEEAPVRIVALLRRSTWMSLDNLWGKLAALGKD